MNDLISRQAAIEELRDAENHAFNSYYKGLLKAHHIIADLPSIQIEQKPGRWIDAREQCGKFMCSNCQFLCCTNQYNYCPNCGAKMESEV